MPDWTQIFDISHTPQLVLSTDGRIVACNVSASRLLGLTPTFAVGKPLVVYLDAPHRRALLDLLRRTDGTDPWDLRCRLHGRRRRPIDVVLSVAPLPADPGLTHLTVQDVSAANEMSEIATHLATLDGRHRETIRSLHDALEPRPLDVAGVLLGVEYLSADEGSPVGGDLPDWQVLPDGGVHLCVVDATGQGLVSARVAMTVRATARVLALAGTPFPDLLARVETSLAAQEPGATATAVVGRYRPSTGELHLAGAGHPPPLLRTSTGEVTRIELNAPPLGYGFSRPPPRSVKLQVGDRLVIYTDGVAETDRDLRDGIRTLERALTASDLPAKELARQLLPERARDDALVLVLQRLEDLPQLLTGEDRFVRRLPAGELRDVSAVRHELSRWLADRPIHPHALRRVLLAASELITNAVAAASSRVDVRVELDDGQVVLEVADDGPHADTEDAASIRTRRGRGLQIVENLSDDLRILVGPEGTRVRVRLSSSEGGEPDRA